MGYYPVFLELNDRRCLVIGGGAVAERKIAGLLKAGAAVTVISPAVTETIAGWAKLSSIKILARHYQAGDLAGYEVAFVATNDSALGAVVSEEAKRSGVWVNAADDPAHCDFILPSVLRRGDLAVAVSTGGGSPALSRLIREELERYFAAEYEALAALAAEVRKELRERVITPDYKTWRKALAGDLRQLIRRGEWISAKNFLLKELGVAPCG